MNENKVYDVPCQCLRCGNIYLSGNKIIGKLLMGEFGAAWRRQRIEHQIQLPCLGQYTCPICSCGNDFHVDLIDLIEESMKALSNVSLENLLSLQTKLKQNITVNFNIDNSEQAKADIIETVPELSDFKSYLPKTRVEAYAFYGLILTFIGIVIGNLLPGKTPPNNPQVIEKVITVNQENYTPLNGIDYKQLPVKKTKHITSPKHKIGRNDPCYCGCGKKYKNCHGKGL